jgi:hypothetical protein
MQQQLRSDCTTKLAELVNRPARSQPVAWMSEAKSGAILEGAEPGYRFAHPGYDTAGSMRPNARAASTRSSSTIETRSARVTVNLLLLRRL